MTCRFARGEAWSMTLPSSEGGHESQTLRDEGRVASVVNFARSLLEHSSCQLTTGEDHMVVHTRRAEWTVIALAALSH